MGTATRTPGHPPGHGLPPRANEEVTIISTQTHSPDSPDAGFAALGVAAHLVSALDGLGITAPFPIQASTIPVALTGADIIGQAKTGTGKTLAFGIPVLQAIEEPVPAEPAADAAPATVAAKAAAGSSRRRGRPAGGNAGAKLPPAGGTPQALIVVPTRELAVQVCSDLAAAGSTNGVRVHALYGGRAYEPQVKALTEGIDIAVATPGRLLDLVNQGHLVLGKVRTLVLDEADEMLDLGFLPDVERIIKLLPAQRQTMLFSATMPGAVISLARQYMNRPTHIRAADPQDEGISVANIKQFVYRAHDLDKIEMLARILQAEGRGLSMVFARTKRAVARITEELQDRHFAVGAVHGDLAQGAREQALRAFRNGKVDVLVATDVAARGIDVEGVTHVVNYQCPEDEKVYTHRIGRTGRAGRTGISVTLVDWEDMPRWGLINKALGLDYAEPVELYSTSGQLYADLDIPEGAKGALPKHDRVRAGLDAEVLEDLGGPGQRGRGAKQEKQEKQDEPEPRRERTPRQRRRTRGGQGAAPIAPNMDQAAAKGAAPVVESFESPAAAAGQAVAGLFRAPVATAGGVGVVGGTEQDGESAERPKRTRSRKRTSAPVADVAPAVEVAEAVEVVAVADSAVTEAAKPARKRTRKRVGAAADGVGSDSAGSDSAVNSATSNGAVSEKAETVEPAVAVAQPDEAAAVSEKPARSRTRKRAVSAEAAAGSVDAVAAAETTPAVEVAPSDEAKPAGKRAASKTAAKRTTAKTTAAKKSAEPAAKSTAARSAGAKSAAAGRGGAIKLAPGSLADPSLPEPEPVRPEPVNERELSEPVFTQEPIRPAAQRSGERAPRKRTGKKAVAAQGSPNGQVTSSLSAAEQPAAEQAKVQRPKADKPKAEQPAAEHAAPADSAVWHAGHTAEATNTDSTDPAADPLNAGPVANRRRTRI